MRWTAVIGAAAALLACSAGADAAVQVNFSAVTGISSTFVPAGLPITGSFSYDENIGPVEYGGVNAGYIGYALDGSGSFTVAGQTYNYDLVDVFLSGDGSIVFNFANASNSFFLTEFSSNTDLSTVPNPIPTNGFTYFTAYFPATGTQRAYIGADAQFNPGVPEPATWAMMLLGFGAMGAQLRRRRAGTLAVV